MRKHQWGSSAGQEKPTKFFVLAEPRLGVRCSHPALLTPMAPWEEGQLTSTRTCSRGEARDKGLRRREEPSGAEDAETAGQPAASFNMAACGKKMHGLAHRLHGLDVGVDVLLVAGICVQHAAHGAAKRSRRLSRCTASGTVNQSAEYSLRAHEAGWATLWNGPFLFMSVSPTELPTWCGRGRQT